MHLLDLADKAILLLVFGFLQHCPEPLNRETGPIFLLTPPSAHGSVIADQVALLANGVPERPVPDVRG